MKTTNIITAFILVLLSISCKKEPVTQVAPQIKSSSLKAPEFKKYDSKEFDKLVAAFVKQREVVQQQLTSASPEEANNLYDLYLEKNSLAIAAIEKKEEHLISNYYTYFYSGEHKINPPDSIQHKINLLDKAGLEIWDIGEGMVEVRPVPDYYRGLFGSHVTADYRDYIQLNADDDKVLFDNDAAIAIPLEDVGKRIINWEDFIAKYPNSKLIANAKYLYLYYQTAYLFGADNTPVFDSEKNSINPENAEDFRKFCTKYPNSPTTKLVQIVLDAKGDSPQLHDIIIKEQNNMGLDTKIYQ